MPGAPSAGSSLASGQEAWDDAPVLLGRGALFKGLLTFRGIAIVEGELQGEIVGQGTLVLGPEARVKARIEVDELISAGFVEGEVVARARIELAATARIRGELWTYRLGVADGCRVEAHCHTGTRAKSPQDQNESRSPAA